MSTQNPILSALGHGKKIQLSALPTTNDCGGQISVQDWTVQVLAGQLQGSVNLVPADPRSSIVTATLLLSSTDGMSIYSSGVATIVGGGSPGAQVSLQSYTDLFDPGMRGSTVTGVVSGFMLTSSGSCSFYFVKEFPVV